VSGPRRAIAFVRLRLLAAGRSIASPIATSQRGHRHAAPRPHIDQGRQPAQRRHRESRWEHCVGSTPTRSTRSR
jgi:hypothetical protein